ncbi:hypothetical protein ACSVDE_06895 [Pseudalkalibacillus sp. Hm43]|uniref:hypothetical protein n=1 Tax=Pseudalkalibacillus sp. Hm43 TaxID=3450742 RepID=UPI003F4406A1
MTKILGIGWDVGGWMGSKQGIAAATFNLDTQKFEWIGTPRNTNLKKHQHWTPQSILEALDPKISIEEFEEVTIGMDASLGFPIAYRKLVNQEDHELKFPSKEIQNPFAYRDTERHIFEKFGKKPLSAPFDKLGNNTTLALSYALKWSREEGFKMIPQQGNKSSKHVMIEVYPALVKSMEQSFIKEEILKRIPSEINPRSDAYDAAICSILALLFKGNGQFIENVTLQDPCIHKETATEEGWIYYI